MDTKDILASCYGSYETAARVMFEERFFREFDNEHRKIFDLLENSDNPRKLILAPRGVGKTSIDNLLVPAKKLLFHEKRYIVPVGASSTTAEEQSENLKSELIGNRFVNSLFDIKKTDTFSRQKWVVEISGKKSCVQPRGAQQKIRGMLWNNYRPDLIIADDLEDDELVRNEDRRRELKKWFHGALMNTVDRGTKGWEVIVVGTLLHEDSLLANLMEDPSWDKVVLQLFDEDTKKSLFPNFIPDNEVDALITQYRESGESDTLYREYMNMPISMEDQSFRQEYFQYYDNKINFSGPNIENVIVVDFAKTAKTTSADSAIVGGAIDLRNEKIFVRDIVSGKMHPDQIYDEIVAMILRLNARVLGIEVTGLNEFITYPLKNHLSRKGINIELVELHARGGKDEKGKTARVRSLVPFYRQGLVYHNKACTTGLESQLMSFPRSKRWDIMDALGYFTEMLERGQRYMHPQEDEGVEPMKMIENEYRELENDYAMDEMEDFRIV